MARRRNSSSRHSRTRTPVQSPTRARLHSPIANSPLLHRSYYIIRPNLEQRSLQVFDDFRRYHPTPRLRRPLRISDGQIAKTVTQLSNPLQLTHQFADPLRVSTCIRRAMRKEVLHALKKTGRSGSGSRPPRFTERSFIRC